MRDCPVSKGLSLLLDSGPPSGDETEEAELPTFTCRLVNLQGCGCEIRALNACVKWRNRSGLLAASSNPS